MGNDIRHISVAGLDQDAMETLLSQKGLDKRYARRLLYWIYRKGIRAFDEINDIPKRVISDLADHFTTGLFDPVSSEISADGSIKYLFRNEAGLVYETVYLPESKRHTVCVSVQSGCRMGCRFCATGINGWKGDLAAGEIINQVVRLPHRVTHVVMMGMGEPGDNIDEVIKAYSVLTGEWGLAVGRSRVTVSTVGLTPSVKRLLHETECNITLSLHSPFHDERRLVIPAENHWPYTETLELMKAMKPQSKRRFTVAYVMVKGKNDSEKHLKELKILLSGTGIRINLLPYHPVAGDLYDSSDEETMMEFKHLLITSGIEASVRRSRGTDIAAACGMLAANAGM